MKSSEKPLLAYIETNEQRRLNDTREKKIPWKKWGPYLSERQWGTVREDYSDNGDQRKKKPHRCDSNRTQRLYPSRRALSSEGMGERSHCV